MARQTTVQISVENPQTGNVIVEGGTLTGINNRSVTLRAIPVPGYKFKEWQVEEYALRTYPANFINRFSTIQEACSQATSENPVGTVFFENPLDGVLYADSNGSSLVEDGIWYTGNFNYIIIQGNRPITSQICPTSGGGGGGDGEGGGGGGSGDISI